MAMDGNTLATIIAILHITWHITWVLPLGYFSVMDILERWLFKPSLIRVSWIITLIYIINVLYWMLVKISAHKSAILFQNPCTWSPCIHTIPVNLASQSFYCPLMENLKQITAGSNLPLWFPGRVSRNNMQPCFLQTEALRQNGLAWLLEH